MEFGGSGKEFIVLKVYAILSNSIYSHPSNAFQKQKQKKKTKHKFTVETYALFGTHRKWGKKMENN